MDIRFHGNGFIQVYLNSHTRLHVWSPAFPATRVQNAQIHDHRFWFCSKVLLGALYHQEYEVYLDGTGKHGLYQTAEHSKVAPLERIGKCSISERGLSIYYAGDEYYFGGPDKYHHTFANELTVTLMTKLSSAPDYNARMVALNDETPDHAFENQPDTRALRAELNRAILALL